MRDFKSPCSHRGVSAPSLRGAGFQSVYLSGTAWERQFLSWQVLERKHGSHRGHKEHGGKILGIAREGQLSSWQVFHEVVKTTYSAITPHGDRSVSPSFSYDGAIRFCTCLEKQGSHRGHREHGDKILGNTWERQLSSWQVFAGP